MISLYQWYRFWLWTEWKRVKIFHLFQFGMFQMCIWNSGVKPVGRHYFKGGVSEKMMCRCLEHKDCSRIMCATEQQAAAPFLPLPCVREVPLQLSFGCYRIKILKLATMPDTEALEQAKLSSTDLTLLWLRSLIPAMPPPHPPKMSPPTSPHPIYLYAAWQSMNVLWKVCDTQL